MVCDAMTKGNLSREPLLKLWRTALLEIIGETPIVWLSSPATSSVPTDSDDVLQRRMTELKI